MFAVVYREDYEEEMETIRVVEWKESVRDNEREREEIEVERNGGRGRLRTDRK